MYIYIYKGREGVGGFPTFPAASECQVGQTVLVATNESKHWWATQRRQGAKTTKTIWKYIYTWKYNEIHMKSIETNSVPGETHYTVLLSSSINVLHAKSWDKTIHISLIFSYSMYSLKSDTVSIFLKSPNVPKCLVSSTLHLSIQVKKIIFFVRQVPSTPWCAASRAWGKWIHPFPSAALGPVGYWLVNGSPTTKSPRKSGAFCGQGLLDIDF